MTILALDSTTDICNLGIRKNEETFCCSAPAAKRQLDVVFPLLDDLLDSTGIKRKEIQGLIVPIGPGSFTGVRMTATIGRAIATALKVRLIGVSSLEALATTAARKSRCPNIATATDARRKQVYFAAYVFEGDTNSTKTIVKDRIAVPSEITPLLGQPWALAGEGWYHYENQLERTFLSLEHTGVTEMEISDILAIGERKFRQNSIEEDIVSPIYLRHPVDI